ncbi:MAG: carbon storage regulator CsrA [Planctomycetaceae bacterium]|nr:carbon storage regulator CsrA [Planctomycetaceae bacterium]
MLVLSRKRNESVVINDQIVVTVIEVRGDKVRLGIQAPRDVPIHRSEVMAAIQRAQEVGAADVDDSNG